MKIKIMSSSIVMVLTMLACSSAAFPAPDPTAMPTPIQTLAESISQSVTLTSAPFSEDSQTPIYKITAQIPLLVGNNDPRLQAFNAELKEIVQKEIDVFKKEALQNTNTPPPSVGSFLNVRYELVGQQGNFWSLKFKIEVYVNGAAHPYDYSIPVNYDLGRGRDVTSDESFLPNSDYLQFLSQYCIAELSKRDIGFDGFQQGADPTPENYRNWNLSGEGLVITFDEYQVAPYAAGAQTVVIQFSELAGLVNDQGSIAPFLP